MSVASRPVSTGKTRTCPHCKATILESLSICPGCMHHLRFDSEAAKRQVAAAPALRVEGIIRHPPLEPPLEYFVIIAIRNDRGEEVTRQVVNVGALQAAEKRTFTLSVEVLPPQAPVPPQKSTASTGTFKAPTAPQPSPATVRPSTPTLSQQPQPAATVRPPVPTPSSPAGTSSPTPPQAQPKPPTPPTSPAAARPLTSGAPPVAPKQASNPNAPGAPNTPKAPTPNTGGYTNPNNPAAPAKPESGYVLKPPSPGGPKRH
jgi:hypothetical protein